MSRSINMDTSQRAGSTCNQTLMPLASNASNVDSNRSISSQLTFGHVPVAGWGKCAQQLPLPPPPDTSTTTAICSPTEPGKRDAIELIESTHQVGDGNGEMP